MDVENPGFRTAFRIDGNFMAKLRPSRADDLRDRAFRIGTKDLVDAAQLGDDPLPGARRVSAGDAAQVFAVGKVDEAEIGARRHD